MLDLRPNCECCDKDLPNGAPDALICTYECTFCADCANAVWAALPQLRRRPGEAADPPRAHAGQASGLDQARPQGPRRLPPGRVIMLDGARHSSGAHDMSATGVARSMRSTIR